MKYIFLFLSLTLRLMDLQAQNMEFSGSPIEISVNGYTTGEIQWQSSADKITWIDIPNGTASKLNYTIHESTYFRSKITTCDSVYFSDTNYIQALNIEDEAYKKVFQPVFKLKDLTWLNVPVPSSYRQSQTHPSIIYSDKNWNGYNVWLATSPFPFTDNFLENPCIYYSQYQDSVLNPNFQPILNNPIDKIDVRGEGYNADPEIFLDDSVLYCIEKKQLVVDRKYHYMIQSSRNGQNWTPAQEMFNSDLTQGEIVSPAIIKYNNKFRIYGAQANVYSTIGGTFHNFVVLESNSLHHPDFKVIARPKFANKGSIELWHFDLFDYKNILCMVLCGKNTYFSDSYLSTYLAVSLDHENFYIFPQPLFNEVFSYRPTAFVDKEGNLKLVLSTMDPNYKTYSKDGNEIATASINMKKLLDTLITDSK